MTSILKDMKVVGVEVDQSADAGPLSAEELRRTDAFWRACNYLAAGMIYLRHNPLLREPLKAEPVKRRLLGHWGASPGLSFAYLHLNRPIKKYDLDAIFLAGPGPVCVGDGPSILPIVRDRYAAWKAQREVANQ